jgi:hypothetical protein
MDIPYADSSSGASNLGEESGDLTGFPGPPDCWLARQLRLKRRFQARQTCQVWEMVNEQAPGIPVGASAV